MRTGNFDHNYSTRTRRDFLKGSAWMLGLAAMSGCMVDKISVGTPAANFRVPAMSKIRVGFIGIGNRGMDFIMNLRWAYCLQNGLPLDMDVYDLASWSAIVPCSAKSALKMGERVEIPDFTRGAWKSAKPLSIGAIDLKKMNLQLENVKRDDSQLSV